MRVVLFLCGAFMLSGCTPFIDARREAGQILTVGQSRPEHPAVCYNPLFDSPESVQSLAQSECQKNKKQAVFNKKEYFSCCLFYPSTAFYDCQKEKK